MSVTLVAHCGTISVDLDYTVVGKCKFVVTEVTYFSSESGKW